MEKQLRGKVFSTFLMMCICVAVMIVLWHFTPAKATDTETPSFTPEQTVTETPAAESPQPTESVEPTETPSQEPTETPEETASPEGTEALPENTENPTLSPAPVESSAPVTDKPVPTKTPAATPTPIPTPVVPTTPPKLELLTPPGVTATTEVLPTEDAGFEELLPGETFVPTPTPRVEHIEQVEIDAGFQLSDFIEILCWIMYTLAGTFLLFGLARIAILMLLKRDILPSKKEREKAKAERLRKAADKEHKIIETDISQEEYQIHKDDWNWK